MATLPTNHPNFLESVFTSRKTSSLTWKADAHSMHTPFFPIMVCAIPTLHTCHRYHAAGVQSISLNIGENFVPDIRSNRWTKSWKKYFIELVYLRGYAMLYPNYADFVSFSTNHLEVGSHVKDRPNDVYLQRKELFLLPLMSLSDNSNSSMPSSGILDLPGETLPPWHSLPILNLTGSLTLL